MVEGLGFILAGCEPKPVRFLNFPSKVRRVRRSRRSTKSRAGCAGISCGARNQSAFFVSLVRTKTRPLFEFSVEGARGPALQAIDEKSRWLAPAFAGTQFQMRFAFAPAILKQKADTPRVYHVRSSEIRPKIPMVQMQRTAESVWLGTVSRALMMRTLVK
jgi:hypothetical protein